MKTRNIVLSMVAAMMSSVHIGLSSQIYVANSNFDIELPGNVFVINGDDEGNIYIGGAFCYINGEVRSNIAKLKADGTLDSAWIAEANNPVERIVPTASGIYLSGPFEYVGGASRTFLAKVNSSNGNVVAEFNPPIPDNVIYSIAFYNSALYIGGAFTSLNGNAAQNIAKLDASSGAQDTSFTNGPTLFGIINTIAADNTGLYPGGFFSDIGGENRFFIARLDLSSGNPFSNTYLNGADSFVRENVIDGNFLYSIGYFTTMDTQSRDYIARMIKTNGTVDSWNTHFDVDAEVMAVCPVSNGVYVSGFFTNIGLVARTNIAKLRVDNAAVITSFNASANGYIDALFYSDDKLFVGGHFQQFNSAPALSIAALNPETGEQVSNFNATIGQYGKVNAVIKLADDSIIIGGDFSSIRGFPVCAIARIMPDGSIDTNFNLQCLAIPPITPYVSSLATDNTYLYIAGSFISMLGNSITNMAKVRISDWTLDTSFKPNPVGEVYAMAITSGALYVGGSFNAIGGNSRTNIAKLNITNGLVEASFIADTESSGYITDMAIDGENLYICGNFIKINGNTSKYVAKLNGTTGISDPLWTNCANNRISSICVTTSNVYIGGDYSLAKFNKDTGIPDAEWHPVVSGYVYQVQSYNGHIYVGGSISYAGGIYIDSFCRIDALTGVVDTNWLPSPDGTIYDFLFDSPYIYVAGIFSEICGERQQAFAVLTHQPPQVEITTVSDDDCYKSIADITLKSSVTSPVGYAITQVQYYANGSLVGKAVTSPYTVNWTSVTEGTYALYAVAYDEQGLRGRSEQIRIFVMPFAAAGDFDGDLKADPALNLRDPATGKNVWYAWLSGNSYSKAGPVLPSTIEGYPLAGDIDGDLKADPVLVSSFDSSLDWHGWLSGNGYAYMGPYHLGSSLSDPAIGDIDGDSKADPIVCLRISAHNEWQTWLSGNGYTPSGYIPIGTNQEGYTLAADFDGDSKADLAIVNVGETQSVWQLWLSVSGYQPYTPVYLSSYAGFPVAADFDGDSKADPAMYVPIWAGYNAGWYGWLSSANYQRYGPYPFTAP